MTTNQRGLVVLVGLLVFAAVVCVATPFIWLPGSGLAAGIPVIQVPGEILIHHWKPLGIDLGADFNLINTMVALFIADVIVALIAVIGFFGSRRWTKEVPGRFQGMLELIVGGLFGFVKNTAGSKNARAIFPLVATIFFFLLIGNWMSVIPGVESIGLFHCAHPNTNGYQAVQIGDNWYRLDNTKALFGGDPVSLAYEEECVAATGLGEGEHAAAATEGEHAAEGEGDPLQTYRFHITPFVRPAATDLNLTIGLALISFFFIQYYGFKEQGLNYLQKFIPVHSLGNLSKKPLGAIDLIVGPLEFVSELSKIVSLSFRLFGNIFAGGILIAVMLFLVGTGLPVIFYALELIVGLAQALVFAVLTLVFIAQAMEGHHGDEESH
ncbi:MAG: F0F1 ATP synthase subunit A [Anaerolineaceae bacterium]|nr:F0F1 ATP synthase subunit A [Anaerolineaceae bacterium]